MNKDDLLDVVEIGLFDSVESKNLVAFPAQELHDLLQLAAMSTACPSAFLLVRHVAAWESKAIYGIGQAELALNQSLLNLLLEEQPTQVVISDFGADPRTDKHQLFITGPLHRSCAIVKIPDQGDLMPAFLVVSDAASRSFSETHISCLSLVARQVAAAFSRQLMPAGAKAATGLGISQKEINAIFRNAISGVVVVDRDGKVLQVNNKAEAIFGRTEREVHGLKFEDVFIEPKFRDTYRRAIESLAGDEYGPGLSKILELSATNTSNRRLNIVVSVSPAEIRGKEYFINFISDITERKQATEEMDRQKEFYENILNQLPADIAVFDANHKYLFVNPGAIKDPELRKYIVGKDDFEYAEYRGRDKSVAQSRRDQFLQVKNSGKEIRWEDNTVNDPNGNPVTHLRRLFPVFDAQGQLSLVIGFGIDISDRKLMEVKQTALVKQLSAQNTQLIDFCNIVSHNLRAPLVNMSMLVDFITETENVDEQEMLITKLKPVLDNLHNTFNELVESIQIKQDHEIKSEKNNLEHCLQRTLDGFKMEINKSGAVIEHDFSQAPVIYCPSKYLFSIFHNLVSNSLKYQSPKRAPLIRLETRKQNGSIILSVKDNGLGIDLTKHKDNIFKIGKVFHRHPNAKGFGLFMTRTQVEAMEGRIWAESTPGEGSVFFIEFKNQK